MRTEEVCQPVMACTMPVASSAEISSATWCGERPPSMVVTRISRPRIPLPELISSPASVTALSFDGTAIASGPRIGTILRISSVCSGLSPDADIRYSSSRSSEQLAGGKTMALIVSRTATLHGALRAAERRWLRHLDDALCARQLSPDQWSMLCNLSADTGITMSQLAAKSRLAPSPAPRHAAAPTDRRLVFRVCAEEDRRRNLLGLSARGDVLVEAVRADEALDEQRTRITHGELRYDDPL